MIRRLRGRGPSGQQAPLHLVIVVEVHDRHAGIVGRPIRGPPSSQQVRGGHGHVSHDSEGFTGTALHRLVISSHRGHHPTAA